MNDSLAQSLVHQARQVNSSIPEAWIVQEVQDFRAAQVQVMKAQKSGDLNQQIAARKTFFRSKSVKRLAILVIRNPKDWPDTKYNVDQEIIDMTPGAACSEVVTIKAIAKTSLWQALFAKSHPPLNSSYRLIHRLGRLRKSKNWIADQYLRLILPIHPSNFLTKGVGIEDFAQATRGFLAKGHKWFVLFDIKDFYGSVQNGPWLEEATGLKGDLINEEIFTSKDTLLVSQDSEQEHLLKAAQQGLAQGRATSSTVAGFLYGKILGDICPADRCLYYGDDGLIAASSQFEGEAIAHKLKDLLEHHPAGPFSLSRCELAYAEQGFEILKYWHKLNKFGGSYLDIGNKSYSRLQDRTFDRIVKSGSLESAEEIAESYLQNWLTSHPSVKITESVVDLAFVAQSDAIDGANKFLVSKSMKVKPSSA